MIPARHVALLLVAALSAAIVTTASSQGKAGPDPSTFPLSAWQQQKEITQIPWTVRITKPTIRFDLRQELTIWGSIQSEEHRQHELTLFARVTERGNVVSDVFPISLEERNVETVSLNRSSLFATQPGAFSSRAIVRPGKYRLELALLDRTTNQYNVRFENVTVEGIENPVERAFEAFDKFEFGRPMPPEQREHDRRALEERARASVLDASVALSRGGLLLGWLSPAVLNGSSNVYTPDRPSFVVGKSRTTHVSVITILNPPERAIGNTRLLGAFRTNLSNLLSVVTRLDAPSGTAKLTGIDLMEHTRVLDEVDLKEVTPELLDPILKKDTTTVSLESLAKKSDQGAFFREVLGERLVEAASDSSGAEHVIIVVSASLAFPGGSRLTIPRTRDCHCQVFYLKFALVPREADDIDNILQEYKPQIFEPLTWPDFRDDFGKIYGQLLR